MIAMLFNVAVPLGICRCEGCHCENSLSRFFPDPATTGEKCCCASPETVQTEEHCSLPETPCSCQCGSVQQDDATAPVAVLSVKVPNGSSLWDSISATHTDFIHVPKTSFSTNGLRTFFSSPVPLYVLLCVFLN
jgi:hypothetical protein